MEHYQWQWELVNYIYCISISVCIRDGLTNLFGWGAAVANRVATNICNYLSRTRWTKF